MNVREATGIDLPYETFNREERNLAAIFFHVLNLPGNLERFLEATGCGEVEAGFSPAVYFEYAYLRDLWSLLDSNEPKHNLISSCLHVPGLPGLDQVSVEEFNRMFGATPKPSRTDVQNPGTWSLAGFDASFPDNDEFLAVCMFKWCFKAKPDLVIQLGPDRVVCIEAKLESGEGSYPSATGEKGIFDRRGLDRVGQTEVQRFMFERLLGMRAEFLLLARKAPRKSSGHRLVSWAEAFRAMDTAPVPEFMRETVKQCAETTPHQSRQSFSHNMTPEFKSNRAGLEREFPAAYEFLMRLDDAGPRYGLWLSCATNAHLYKDNGYLAYIRLVHQDQRPSSIVLSPRYNIRINEATTDQSNLLFPELVDNLVAAEGGFGSRWVQPRSNGAIELRCDTPTSFFDRLFDAVAKLEVVRA